MPLSQITLKPSKIVMPGEWSAKRDTKPRFCCKICSFPEHRCTIRQEAKRIRDGGKPNPSKSTQRPPECTFLTKRRELRKKK